MKNKICSISYIIKIDQEVAIMKYAIVEGKLTHISKVKKGTVAREFGYSDHLVIAVGGKERKYWKYLDVKRASSYHLA